MFQHVIRVLVCGCFAVAGRDRTRLSAGCFSLYVCARLFFSFPTVAAVISSLSTCFRLDLGQVGVRRRYVPILVRLLRILKLAAATQSTMLLDAIYQVRVNVDYVADGIASALCMLVQSSANWL